MSKWIISDKADMQLVKIYEDGKDIWGEEQATKYQMELLEHVALIQERQELSKKRGNSPEGVLSQKYGRHYIFYREVSDERIEITEILHDSMDLENYFDADMEAEKRAYEREKAERKRRDDLDYDLER